MKGKLKTISLILALVLLFNIFAPTMRVFATVGNIIFDGYNSISGDTVEFQTTLEDKDFTIYMWLEDEQGDVEISSNGTGYVDNFANIKVNAEIYTDELEEIDYGGKIGLDLAGTKVMFKSTKVQIGEGEDEFVYTYNLALPEGTTQLMVRNQDFIYEDTNVPSVVEFKDIQVSVTFNNTMGEVIFNNQGSARTPEGASYSGTLVKAGNTDSSEKNEITINTAFGENIASAITINGIKYDVNNTYSNTFEVAGAESYTIVVDGVEDANAPRTLIWANPDYVPTDEEDAEWVSQFSIEHGNAKIIAVYDENGNKLNPSDYINSQEQPDGSKSDEYGLRNGFGWISVKPGYKATFEFYPEYGYQLTSVAINEQPMKASTTANQFTVEIPNGNLHFAAKFTKTDDVVKAGSEKISSGEISLGNTLEGGTAQLTVNDVELSSDKIKGFENAAGEYTISNYLDIDLYNVFYKGKADSSDVWSNKISELDKEATISLKLADGITADDIVLVHNIHDGEEYEIIEIESYDAETNTITFKTKSFSNYAIATKTATTEEAKTAAITNNPTTGDNIAFMIVLFAVATLGTIATIIIKKKSSENKH